MAGGTHSAASRRSVRLTFAVFPFRQARCAQAVHCSCFSLGALISYPSNPLTLVSLYPSRSWYITGQLSQCPSADQLELVTSPSRVFLIEQERVFRRFIKKKTVCYSMLNYSEGFKLLWSGLPLDFSSMRKDGASGRA
jgi:hypothetical protein